MTEDSPLPPPPRQDNSSRPEASRFVDDFIMGLRFFSRLPTGDLPHELPNLSRMAPAAPFASLAIGLLPAFLMMGAAWLGVPGLFAGGLGVMAMVVVTGAMPEDALADTADGMFGGSTYERRLDIMKDSRHGTYGVAALALYLILRVTAIGPLAAVHPLEAAGIWLAATVIARSGSLWLSVELPSAREGGASAGAGRPNKRAFTAGAGFATMLCFVLAAPFVGILGVIFGLLAAAGVALAWVSACRRLVGGQTGDLIGALHALIEIAVITVFLIFA